MGNGAGKVPGADPGFPVGGRDDTPGGANIRLILPNFSKKKKKFRTFWAGGWGWGTPGFSNLLFGKNCIKMKPFDPDRGACNANTSIYFCTRL